MVAPYDHLQQSLADRLQHPSVAHWLGTDELGRDVLSRIIFGARISLTIGLVPTLISMAIGTVLGMYAGFYGGKVDFIIMRLADVMLAFPSRWLLWLSCTHGRRPDQYFHCVKPGKLGGNRLHCPFPDPFFKGKRVRGGSRSIGVKKWVIMFRHILPNCIPSLIVLFTLNIPSAILSEASLSFLGGRRAAAECQLGSDGCSRQEISVLGTLAFHRAECGYHDRGHGIQLPGGWPPGCAGSVLERAVKERRDEHE